MRNPTFEVGIEMESELRSDVGRETDADPHGRDDFGLTASHGRLLGCQDQFQPIPNLFRISAGIFQA